MDFILGILIGIALCLAYGNYLLKQRKKEAGRSLDNLKKSWMNAAKITPEDMQYLSYKPPIFPLSKEHAEYLDSQITSSEFSLDEGPQHTFIATGDVTDILQALASDKRIKNLTISGGHEEYHHLPEPDYIFEYENTPVPCEDCKKLIPREDIIKDYDSDEIGEICPNCDGYNTFDYEYEKISDAIKSGD